MSAFMTRLPTRKQSGLYFRELFRELFEALIRFGGTVRGITPSRGTTVRTGGSKVRTPACGQFSPEPASATLGDSLTRDGVRGSKVRTRADISAGAVRAVRANARTAWGLSRGRARMETDVSNARAANARALGSRRPKRTVAAAAASQSSPRRSYGVRGI
jgi:hypothetical protein